MIDFLGIKQGLEQAISFHHAIFSEFQTQAWSTVNQRRHALNSLALSNKII